MDAIPKFKEMVSTFKANSDKMLNDISMAFDKAIEASLKSYVGLQSAYLKGYGDLYGQGKKANEEMVKTMDDNMKSLKEQWTKNFTDMTSGMNKGLEESNAAFRKECEDHFKKFPDLNPTLLKEALTAISSHQKATTEANNTKFKSITEMLDKRYKSLLEEVSLPPLTLPKLVEPVIKPTASTASTSKKK